MEELPFDPTLKKKKKKKKPFDLEAALEGGDGLAAPAEGGEENVDPQESSSTQPAKTEDESKGPPEGDVALDDAFNIDFGGLKKKKKKKKVTIDLEDPVETFSLEAPASAEPETEIDTNADAPGEEVDLGLDDDLGLDLMGMKKKKKKKKPLDITDITDDMDDIKIDGEDDDGVGMHGMINGSKEVSDQINLIAWRPDSDRDYTYDELLARVFEIMRQKNPDMVAGEKKKFVMRPPQVVRAGAKKTSFVNFTEICRLLHRQPKHLMAFLMAELGTSGSVDGTNQLVIKGRFQQKQIENVLRRYIKEYVTCHTCRSPETMLQRDTRLYFLQCETCGSRCSVATIKSGFQAMTGKRAAMRAKAQ